MSQAELFYSEEAQKIDSPQAPSVFINLVPLHLESFDVPGLEITPFLGFEPTCEVSFILIYQHLFLMGIWSRGEKTPVHIYQHLEVSI